VFLDEFGFSFLETMATTWAPKGQRPIFRRVTKDRRALSTIAALTLTGKVYKLHFAGSLSGEQVTQFLKHLQRHVPGNLILIWDRARIHTGATAQAYLQDHPEIRSESLPAYAPELNPEEYCHGNVKRYLKNARPEDKKDMQTLLNHGFNRLRRKPSLLLKFFHSAGLNVRQFQLQ
jgi:transposase